MDYLNYFILEHIDFGTLAILLCLMLVVDGFTELGYMDKLANGMVKRTHKLGSLLLALTMICFVISMFVTNDVALIVMVPFSIQILNRINCNHKMIKLVVLETIAANLGSMLTPIGNPQNVFLYQTYEMNLVEFFKAVWLFALVSAVLLVGLILLDKDRNKEVLLPNEHISLTLSLKKGKKIKTAVYGVLFIICLLTVLDVIPYYYMLAVTIVCVSVCNYKLIFHVNYGLLVKFVVLFILVGNLANIPWISSVLDKLVVGNEFVVGIGFSQFLSNVPTAIMLSEFTENGMELLQGVNVGGLGTLIASMASMISLEYYGKAIGANKKMYIIQFTLYNIVFLAVLVLFHCIL